MVFVRKKLKICVIPARGGSKRIPKKSASIIEKHVTLDRKGGGPDDSFSLEYDELLELCVNAKTAWEALGRVDYGRKSSEQGNVKFRRSLYFTKDIKAGEVITKDHVKSIRLVGKVVKNNISAGTAVTKDIVI